MSKVLSIILLAVSAATASALAPNDIKLRQLGDERVALQSRFAKAQQALGLDPLKAPAEAQIEMESFGKALSKLKEETLLLLNERYIFWNNQSYWSYLWDKGPAAKFVVAKLRGQIDAAASLSLPMDAPFGKPEINTFQKQLDALRGCIELDRQLQQMQTQLKNAPRR